MEHKESGAGQTLRKKRACRKRIRAVLALLGVSMICALVACVVVPVMQRAQEDKTVQAESTTAQATIETIQKTVFGSGEVQPLSQPASMRKRMEKPETCWLRLATALRRAIS